MTPHQLPFGYGEVAGWRPPALPDLSAHREVTLDCETDGLEWFRGARPVGMAYRLPATGETGYLPWAHRGGQNLDEATVKRWARRELRGKRIRNLNTRFDIHMLRAWGVDLTEQDNTFHDVAHSAALLDDHRRRFSLEELAQDELGEGKGQSGRKAEIGDLPASAVAAYAVRDVELVDQLYDLYAPRLEADDLMRVSVLEDAIIPVVCEMEKNGCPINEDKLNRWLARSQEILEQMLWQLQKMAGFSLSPNRPGDTIRLFSQLGIENPHRTKPTKTKPNGVPSFTDGYLKTIRHPTVQLLRRAGKLMDLRSKFLTSYRKLLHNGVLYGAYHQLKTDDSGSTKGTVSGRFSSTHPNLQQVMKPSKQVKDYGVFDGETFVIRELFEAREGQWFCADQQAVEFRFAACYSKAQRVIEAYQKNPWVDFHDVVGDMVKTRKPEFERDGAKTINYTRLYGGGEATVAGRLHLSLDETREILSIYDAEFPEMGETLRRAKETAEERGYVKTILGRRSRFPNGQRTYKALNCVLQGSAADLNKMVLVDLYRKRKEFDIVLRNTNHDEVNCDARDPTTIPALVACLNEQRLKLPIPILWQAKTGANWAEAK